VTLPPPAAPFVLDDAAEADVPALAAMLGAWVRACGWMPVLHSAEEDAGFVLRLIRSHLVRVARAPEGVPLGFLARRHGDIAAFCVRADRRGQGIGTALMAEAMAREDRIALWTFAANTGALAFYARHGFAEVERTDGSGNEEGLPDVRLIWRRGQA
jgi:GNAT superfamily N-acetyltransferase